MAIGQQHQIDRMGLTESCDVYLLVCLIKWHSFMFLINIVADMLCILSVIVQRYRSCKKYTDKSFLHTQKP